MCGTYEVPSFISINKWLGSSEGISEYGMEITWEHPENFPVL